MELQWPLILFTTFLCASAGLFTIQSVYALNGKGTKAQLPALIVSFVMMVIGGVAVFFHLQHWERIFNGFGHITSGITQELIAIVVLFVMMVIFFVQIRRNEKIAKWAAIAGIVVGVLVVLVCGLSYMMPSRPAWNTILQILSLYGLAAAAGAGFFAAFDGEEADRGFHGIFALIGAIVALVFAGAFIAAMASAVTSSYVSVGGYYFDPNHPTIAMATAAAYSPFAEGTAGFTWATIALVVVTVVFAVIGKLTNKWAVCGSLVAVCALAAGITLRAVFFCCGGSLFMFF